ncbi:MAG: hypothetical protein IJB50_02165, partial [Clostridia bacterium]|nr:hypothetical protein [Clostridia bacterium]
MKVKKVVSLMLLCVLFVFMVLKTQESTECVLTALKLCVNTVIPSLFPFFVLSGLLVNLGFIALFGKILTPISKLLFKTSGKGAVVFVIGIICGYPTGAKVVADMCREKSLTKEEAERLLAFCNNSGPLFIIGAIGTTMLKNHSLGVALYIIHLLSAIFVGVLMGIFAKNEKALPVRDICVLNIGTAFAKSIEGAVKSILNVCGYVVFFSILCAMAKNVFLISILEVTTGAKNLIDCGFSEKITFVLLSAILGFGGICVLLQVQSEVSKAGLSLRLYVLGKILQSLISMAIAFLYV